MKKLENGLYRDLTTEEVAEYNARQSAYNGTETQRKLAILAAHRYSVESGGITINGIPVATDDRSKLMLTGARNAAISDETFTTKWKTAGGFVELTAAQIIALSDAVASHVNACFTAEAAVAGNIAEYSTPEQIKSAFNGEMA